MTTKRAKPTKCRTRRVITLDGFAVQFSPELIAGPGNKKTGFCPLCGILREGGQKITPK